MRHLRSNLLNYTAGCGNINCSPSKRLPAKRSCTSTDISTRYGLVVTVGERNERCRPTVVIEFPAIRPQNTLRFLHRATTERTFFPDFPYLCAPQKATTMEDYRKMAEANQRRGREIIAETQLVESWGGNRSTGEPHRQPLHGADDEEAGHRHARLHRYAVDKGEFPGGGPNRLASGHRPDGIHQSHRHRRGVHRVARRLPRPGRTHVEKWT